MKLIMILVPKIEEMAGILGFYLEMMVILGMEMGDLQLVK